MLACKFICKRTKKSEDYKEIFTLFYNLFSFEYLSYPRALVVGVAGSMVSASWIGIYFQTPVIVFGAGDVIIKHGTVFGEDFTVFRVFGEILAFSRILFHII